MTASNDGPASRLLAQNIEEWRTLASALPELSAQAERAASSIAESFAAGGTLFACGNGGSAADAAHLTTELVIRFKKERKGLPAVCLNAHGGDLTAAGNDYEFARVFARQLESLGRPGDVLVAFSTSGSSANVNEAVKAAIGRGMRVVSMIGKGGGAQASIAAESQTVNLIVPSDSTARVQEAHTLLLHTLVEAVEELLGL